MFSDEVVAYRIVASVSCKCTALIRVPYRIEKSLVVLTPWFLRMFLMELEELVHDQPWCYSKKGKKTLTSASQTGQNRHTKMLHQTLPVLSKAKTINLCTSTKRSNAENEGKKVMAEDWATKWLGCVLSLLIYCGQTQDRQGQESGGNGTGSRRLGHRKLEVLNPLESVPIPLPPASQCCHFISSNFIFYYQVTARIGCKPLLSLMLHELQVYRMHLLSLACRHLGNSFHLGGLYQNHPQS